MKSIAAIAALTLFAGAACAQYAESGDAGQLLPGQATGSGALTTITGALTGGDIDLFAINIVDFANFTATVTGSFDSQLFLFNASGLGVVANDDQPSNAQSRIQSALVNANGLYYIAISSYNLDPISSGGLIFPNTPFTGQNGPTGPGGGSALSGWQGSGSGSTNNYTITFTGTEAVPTPGAFALMGMGGLLAARRRRA